MLLALLVTNSAGADHVKGEDVGELDDRHCHYVGETKYRHSSLIWEDPRPIFRDATDAGASNWNDSGDSPADFVSLGTAGSGGAFRVIEHDNPASGVVASWHVPSGCSAVSPLADEWLGDSSTNTLRWNISGNPTSANIREAVAVHELGHAIGLHHFWAWYEEDQCSGTPISTMGAAGEAWVCTGDEGPHPADADAAANIRVKGRFWYRNGLTSGTGSSLPYLAEDDDYVVAGFFGDDSRDRPASFDNDRYGEHVSGTTTAAVNQFLYDDDGGLGAPRKFRENFVDSPHARGRVVVGDTNGFVTDELAFHDPVLGRWKIGSPQGTPGSWFYYGIPGDVPLLGDWDSDLNETETIGVFRPGTGQWFLRNTNDFGLADIAFYYGSPGDIPIVGNWDDSEPGAEIGVVRGNMWYLRRNLSTGFADLSFGWGTSGMQPMLGDWDGDDEATPGYFLQ